MKNSDYIKNREWSDKFIPEIKRILGETFIVESSEFKDKNEATDLIIMELEKKCFACRVRKYKYYLASAWRDQFTIRRKLFESGKSEMEKIKEGFGDVYFYGFSNEQNDGSGFVKYTILDLDVFRKFGSLVNNRKNECWGEEENYDNSPNFYWFNIDPDIEPICFPEEMIIKIYNEGIKE